LIGKESVSKEWDFRKIEIQPWRHHGCRYLGRWRWIGADLDVWT